MKLVKNTLFELWKEKEVEWGRIITVAEVAKELKVSRDTVTRFRDGKTSRFDAPIVGKLCRFFLLPPGPVTFLIYVPSVEQTEVAR